MSAIPSWARVGAKVVCIKRGPWRVETGGVRPKVETAPTFGQQLTIRSVFVSEKTGYVMLRFNEIRNPATRYSQLAGRSVEPGYWVERFRPLVTLEDDMVAHFRALLDTPAPTERERA